MKNISTNPLEKVSGGNAAHVVKGLLALFAIIVPGRLGDGTRNHNERNDQKKDARYNHQPGSFSF